MRKVERGEVEKRQNDKEKRGKDRYVFKEPEKAVRRKVSPGIDRIRKMFAKEKKTETSETEVTGTVNKLKSSFELLMDPEKRLREAKESREREGKKAERREKK